MRLERTFSRARDLCRTGQATAARRADQDRPGSGPCSASNAAWTVASIALLFSGAVTPNLLGQALVAMQAISVGAIAELQYVGLRRSGDALAA